MDNGKKINYIYLTAQNFKNDESFKIYGTEKDRIMRGIEKIQKYSSEKEQIFDLLICIQKYQGIKVNEEVFKQSIEKIQEKNKNFELKKLEKAYKDAISETVKTGYLKKGIMDETNLRGNANIKETFKAYSFQGYTSNKELLKAIIDAIIAKEDLNINDEKIKSKSKFYGYQQMYKEVKNTLEKLQKTKDNDAAISQLKKILSSSGEFYRKKWRKQMIKQFPMNGLTKISPANYTNFLHHIVEHLFEDFGVEKIDKELPTNIYSNFQENFLASAWNIAYKGAVDTINSSVKSSKEAKVVSKETEIHYVKNMKIIEKGENYEYVITEEKINNPVQIKTDLTITVENQEEKPTNSSLKFVDIKAHNNTQYNSIRLEDMTIMKIMDYNNNKVLNGYNNFLSRHSDDEENEYKKEKEKIIFCLGFLMLMRGWSGIDPETGVIGNNTIGPAGLFVVQDNTNGDFWVLDIGKELGELAEKIDINVIKPYVPDIQKDLILAENKKEEDTFERNKKAVNELNENYKNKKFIVNFPINAFSIG